MSVWLIFTFSEVYSAIISLYLCNENTNLSLLNYFFFSFTTAQIYHLEKLRCLQYSCQDYESSSQQII